VQASASAVQDTGPAADRYSRFYAAVARAQLTAWLPARPGFLVDISGPTARAAEVARCAGHTVLRVMDSATQAPGAQGVPGVPRNPGAPPGAGRPAGRLGAIRADPSGLEFLADGCADGLIAEDRTLSRQLAAEALAGEIARVLRPGGSVLACVDSLTFGMAVLAEQHHWPHLIDVPNADVVLVPWPDGSITRCYGSEQLRELFTGSGLEVSWIRPRTVFSPHTVSYLLARNPGSFRRLVSAELSARGDDSIGAQLIVCAQRQKLSPAAVPLGLARHAARGGRACLEPGLWYRAPTVHALPVGPAVHPEQGRHHLSALRERRLHRRLVPIRLGQIRASITRFRGPAPGQRMFTTKHQDRPVEFVSHFL
jgi:hypothetical protein